MTKTQRTALTVMDAKNLGAVMTARGWVWRVDVRQSEQAAEAVLAVAR